ncbi:hypothetical protein FB446DRAFT_844726 [Lentinula raphanica]|nr:hypothetical protein FB446DRAFT_844726 [Lentinula raphanica]
MSIPTVTTQVVDALSASYTEGPLDTAGEDLLNQIQLIISDNSADATETIHTSGPDWFLTSPVIPASVCDLPPEILLAIFSYACQTGVQWESSSISLVCRHWRELMLSDPSLWSHIVLNVNDMFPNPTPPLSVSALLRMAMLTNLYLKRSEDCMLSVTIKMPTRFRGLNADWQSYISAGAMHFLQNHSYRIKHLHLRVDHGLLHAFAYKDPCSAEIDSGHDQPCSGTIPLHHLVSLTVEYVSRHCFYFPFQRIPRLKHLTLGNEGFSFFMSSSQAVPALTVPLLTRLVISEPSSFHQLSRTMTLLNALPRIKQVVLKQVPILADLSPYSRQQVISSEISSLKIYKSSVAFLTTFCRSYQFPALKSFELGLDVTVEMAWSILVGAVVDFIRRCPMIQTVTIRDARDAYRSCTNSARLDLEENIFFGPQISPKVRIIGFPGHVSETEEPLTAATMMNFFRSLGVRTGSFRSR